MEGPEHLHQIAPLLAWPPPYKIKRHKRARHVKLRARLPHGLEVTVPYRFNVKDLPAILEEHKAWIIKHLAQLKPQSTDELPEQVILPAMQQTWSVHYLAATSRLTLLQRPGFEIVLLGNIENKALCRHKLMQWLKAMAKAYLTTELNRISAETQLHFNGVTIRDQQTLWGSCSARKSISLNYKLIFLPPPLMRHIIIHELCHTVYMNHSVRFWCLVEKYDPDWRTHRLAMRKGDQYIPDWLSR